MRYVAFYRDEFANFIVSPRMLFVVILFMFHFILSVGSCYFVGLLSSGVCGVCNCNCSDVSETHTLSSSSA